MLEISTHSRPLLIPYCITTHLFSSQDLVGAPSLEDIAERVAKLAEGRTLVGHGLSKDLKVLLLSHPRKDIRDTAK